MPEYLSPGEYIEEVSSGSKSIEGVPTSTTGMAGLAHFGPVRYPGGPSRSDPRLITSFTEFERIYGGLDELDIEGGRIPYLAYAARAFFENGGKRLYISRIFKPKSEADCGVARRAITDGVLTATWKARWPGSSGNVGVETQPMRTRVQAYSENGAIKVRGVEDGSVIEVGPAGSPPPESNAPLTADNLAVVRVDADLNQTFLGIAPTAVDQVVHRVQLTVAVRVDTNRNDEYSALGGDPAQASFVGKVLEKDNPSDEYAMVWLDWDSEAAGATAASLMVLLTGENAAGGLTDGNDGELPSGSDFAGSEADVTDEKVRATGLTALGGIDDIAVVAMPDAATLSSPDETFTATQALIAHCENLRYRIAVVDGPQSSSIDQIREFRGKFNSYYSALYHPWIEIPSSAGAAPPDVPSQRLLVPPSGFIAGIYARSDSERGVHEAPANEVVLGLTRLEENIGSSFQDALAAEGINCLRFFEGRGNLVWGARTMSSDPEWKYVNVRRLIIYIEHSVDNGTQWAVFEPNNETLWANVRQTVGDFLLVLWRKGALMGEKPEEAYFVRCDRTTMSQDDIDNGRLICLVGVAPVKPAEFVIIRIGQWTADAKH